MLKLSRRGEVELGTDHVSLLHRRGRVSRLGDSDHLVEVLDVLGVDFRQRTVKHQLKIGSLGRGTNVAHRRREHEMSNVGTTYGLVALIERFTGELKRLGEVEFTQRRAPERILHTVAIGVREHGIVRRDSLFDRMDRGVPSVTCRLDRGICLDRDFDQLRFRKRSVRGARVRSEKSDRRYRKHQSTADPYLRHPNSSVPSRPLEYADGSERFHDCDSNRLHEPGPVCNRESIK